jgi:hypothetical protein
VRYNFDTGRVDTLPGMTPEALRGYQLACGFSSQ